MSLHVLGNVYKDYFDYQDIPGKRDFRRMVLVDITGENSDIGILTQITGQPPKNPPGYFDQFREPIHKWPEAGLTQMSYARVNKNFTLPFNVLSKPIGKMSEEEFLRIAVAALRYIEAHGFEH
jgi:mRNA interferase MazF